MRSFVFPDREASLSFYGCSEILLWTVVACGLSTNSSAAGGRRSGFPMAEDSGAILRHISSLKDMLDKVRNPPPPLLLPFYCHQIDTARPNYRFVAGRMRWRGY
jgi:hypothetical protein